MGRDVSGLESDSSTPGAEDFAPPRSGHSIELPVLERGVVRERADAARNRLRALAAAERLFTARGVAGVTMDEIAAEAGVGKGTLYRRFGDKGGLAVALLDERERELQERILTGDPPLGPGAPPADRVTAFIRAYLDLVAAQLDLMLMSETSSPGARLRTGAHAFWHQHCRYLLAEAGAADPDLRGRLLLAALSAEQVSHWLHTERRDIADLSGALSAAAIALTAR
ncbi:MAG: TetR/AcrR family transcriptional regulator [Actinomycetota bacterium]|nr:TetR/AcrR family transcriptional regulator [Actinomycetota bacterium]